MANKYMQRVAIHPGVPIATFMSIAGPAVGLLREDGNWMVGLIALLVWVPVLLTARTQPLPSDDERGEHE